MRLWWIREYVRGAIPLAEESAIVLEQVAPGWTLSVIDKLKALEDLLPTLQDVWHNESPEDDALVKLAMTTSLAPVQWTNYVRMIMDAIAVLRQHYPPLNKIDDEGAERVPWRQHCEYKADLEKWGIQVKYGVTRSQLSYAAHREIAAEHARPGFRQTPPSPDVDAGVLGDEVRAVERRYKGHAITLHYLKTAIDKYLGLLDGWMQLDRYMKQQTPARDLKLNAMVLHHYLSEALPLNLDDAPDMPDTEAMGHKATYAKLYKLRTACLKRMKDAQLELAAPVGYAAVEVAKANIAPTSAVSEDSVGYMRMEQIRKRYSDLDRPEVESLRQKLEYWRDHGHEDECFPGDENPETGRRRWAYPIQKVDEFVSQIKSKRPR